MHTMFEEFLTSFEFFEYLILVIYYTNFPFQVIDKTDDNSSGDVEAMIASPEALSVGLQFNSTPGRIMAYEIRVYIEN